MEVARRFIEEFIEEKERHGGGTLVVARVAHVAEKAAYDPREPRARGTLLVGDDVQRTALERFAVEPLEGETGPCGRGHRDEGKAARPPALSVGRDFDLGDLAAGFACNARSVPGSGGRLSQRIRTSH